MTTPLLGWSGLICVALYSSCGQHAIILQYREVETYTFSRAELRVIQAIADDTTRDVRQLLPAIPRTPVLEVIPSIEVIEELGYIGETAGDTVYWGVTPHPDDGIAVIAETHLRAVMFEMFFRMVRAQSVGFGASLPDYMISRGLETVFARDFAATTYAWTDYPDDVADWVTELMKVPANNPGNHWWNRHPDGRRWIAVKAGTYLVDQAIRASGKSVVDLVLTPADEIIRMAQGGQP